MFLTCYIRPPDAIDNYYNENYLKLYCTKFITKNVEGIFFIITDQDLLKYRIEYRAYAPLNDNLIF